MGLSYILLYYRHNIRLSRPQTLKMPKGSGLTKPLNLSTELADLVGAKKGEKLSRPEVVKRLWAHIKTNKLQDPENKQYFVPDTLGSHQDQQAPGPREQAVLRSRHQDAAHLRKGKDPCLRDGQVPQDSPDKRLNHLKVKVSIEEEYLDDNQKFSLNENDSSHSRFLCGHF